MASTQTRGARIVELDVVRGVAVMGILTMNILGFALPDAALLNPLVAGHEGPADIASWALAFILFEGKMRGLFSLLFGASMLLVIERAQASGQSPAAVHFSRMAWLLLFGALHYYLIWHGDILLPYALLGMIAFAFRRHSVKALLISAGVLLGVQLLILLVFAIIAAGLAGAAQVPGADPRLLADWAAYESQFRPSAQALRDQTALYGGSFTGLAAHQLTTDFWTPYLSLLVFGWETLAYFLLGMAAYRTGFLTGRLRRETYRRIALGGLALALPLHALLAWWLIADEFGAVAISAANLAGTTLLRPVMIAAYAALIILLARSGGALTERVAAAGRAAFTNYLGTSLVMTFIFYGWGLGWFGAFSRAELWLFVAGGCALMLLWSKPWLNRFRYGPFEWLWRSLARGRVERLRKA